MSILNRLYDNIFKEKIIDELCFDADNYEWFYRNRFEQLFDELRDNPVEKIFDKDFIEKIIDELCFDSDDIEWHLRGRLNELIDEIKGDLKN